MVARTTLHVNLPLEMKNEMDRVARELGQTSAAAYVAFLHSTMGVMLQLEESERLILRELALYQNFRNGPTPDAKAIANQLRLVEDWLPVAVKKLEARGLLKTDRTPALKFYAMDFMLPDGTHVWITPCGIAAAQVPPPLANRLARSRVIPKQVTIRTR